MANNRSTNSPSDPDDQSDSPQTNQRTIHTHGGDYAEGNIDKRQGTFVEGTIIITEEQAYNVTGLKNPYLGLRAFSAAERTIFAGRERIVQTLVKRLSADDGDRLLFIVGASGSGKSSLARAGLIPGLEDAFQDKHTVNTQIFDYPGQNVQDSLTRLLAVLTTLPSPPMTLILIDQFEEVFREVTAEATLLVLLTLVQSVQHVRVIVTLRTDFLPHLVSDPRFEPYESRKVVVQKMNDHELRNAIQRPIQVHYPEKRIETALLERLVQDAAQDSSYLPLLQVTLENLWDKGALRLTHDYSLATAIQLHANTVYEYRDFAGLQQEPRSAEEKETIEGLLRDLVRVAPGQAIHDVRWRRPRREITQGDMQRERLITDLTNGRLLRTDREPMDGQLIDTVTIVHEALLSQWPLLKRVIDSEREHLRRRERFLLDLDVWRHGEQHEKYLLTDVRLAEAEALYTHGDSVFQQKDAQQFYQYSVQRQEAKQQQELNVARAVARSLQQRLNIAIAFGLATIVVAMVAAGFAYLAQQNANEVARRSTIVEAQLLGSTARMQEDDELGILLALTAYELLPEDANEVTGTIYDALTDLLSRPNFNHSLVFDYGASMVRFHPTQNIAGIAAIEGLFVWDLDRPRDPPREIDPEHASNLAFSGDGTLLAASFGTTIKVWHVDKLADAPTIVSTISDVKAIALHPNGRYLAAAFDDHVEVLLWDLTQPNTAPITLTPPTQTATGERYVVAEIVTLTFSPLNQMLVISGNSPSNSGRVWLQSLDPDQAPHIILGDQATHALYNSITSLDFHPDGTILAGGTRSNGILFWDVTEIDADPFFLPEFNEQVLDIDFSPDGDRLVIAGSERSAYLLDFHFDTDEDLSITRLDGYQSMVTSVSFSADGQTVAATSLERYVRLWQLGTPETELHAQSIVWTDHGEPIHAVAFSPDNHTIAASTFPSTLFLRDIRRADDDPTFLPGYAHTPNALAFSPDGTLMISAGIDVDEQLYIWETERYQDEAYVPRKVAVFRNQVIDVAFAPNNQRFAALLDNGTTMVWDLADMNREPLILQQEKAMIYGALAYTPDSNTLFVGIGDTLLRWDLTQPDISPQRLSIATGSISSLAVNSDGTKLAFSALQGDMLGYWEITETSHRLHVLRRNELVSITTVAFHPDNRTIAAGRNDGTIEIWDTENPNNQPTVLQGHVGKVNDLDYSRDGFMLVSGGDDQSIRLWPSMQGVIAHACTRVWRNLSLIEWYTYLPDRPYQRALSMCTGS